MLTHSTEPWESHLVLESSLCQPVDVDRALSLSVSMTGHPPFRYKPATNLAAAPTCDSVDVPQAAVTAADTVGWHLSDFVLNGCTKAAFMYACIGDACS